MANADAILTRVKLKLGELYDSSEVETWLNSPHVRFDGLTALDAIEAGKSSIILKEIERLSAGAFL